MTDSFYDNAISGQSDTGKGTGKTTAEMKKLATFTDTATTGLSTSWDFNSIWNIRHNYIIQKMIKTPSRTILVNEPKFCSDWQLCAIQIDLTPLTLHITEDSVKHFIYCSFSIIKKSNIFVSPCFITKNSSLEISSLFRAARSRIGGSLTGSSVNINVPQ